MDDNTVRLWLKDHQDAAEKLVWQQAKAFQLQSDTLCSELQETRGLFQNRQRGGDDQGPLLPPSIRLDVLKFSGDDLDRWILSITEYFSFLNTPTEQRLWMVSFNLEGVTADWFQWISRNGLITIWDRFVESVKNRFGPSKYEDPKGALSKLLQLAGVVSIKPTTLGDVFLLARTIEARFDDQAAPVAGTSARLEANKVVNNDDDSESLGEVKVLNWVQQAIDVESTSDNNAQDQASELEIKVLVDGKQDEAKVVDVADEQNSDEPDVLEGNRVIDVGVNENNKGIGKEVQYSIYTLHVFIPLLKRLNDKYIKKKKMKAAMQRRLWDLEIQDNFFRQHLKDKVVFEGVGSVTLVLQEDRGPK
nr:harbinger transposase-derived nuclease domain-containing protein [Tanacetum cinerariifolium]